MAARTGEADVYTRAQRALRPSGRRWLRVHRKGAVGTAVVLAAVALLVDWRVAAAALLAMLAIYSQDRPLSPDARIDESQATPSDGAPTVEVGGLSVFGDVGSSWRPGEASPPTGGRPATERDRRYLRFLPALPAAAAAAIIAWWAGVIDGDAVIRCGLGAMGVLLLWSVAWAAPDMLSAATPAPRDDAVEESPGEDDAVKGGMFLSPTPFVGIGVRFSIADPRLADLVTWVRERRLANAERDGWLRRCSKVVQQLGLALTGAVFLALAIAPHRRTVTQAVWDVGGAIVEIAAVAAGVAMCVSRALRASQRRDVGSVAASVGYVLLVSLLIAVAALLGLLDTWTSLWEMVTGAL